MKVTLYSAQPWDERFFEQACLESFVDEPLELVYQKATLTHQTTALAEGSDAACVFVNDVLDAVVFQALADMGVRAIVLRCAGFNNIDLSTAERLGFFVARAPAGLAWPRRRSPRDWGVGCWATTTRGFSRSRPCARSLRSPSIICSA